MERELLNIVKNHGEQEQDDDYRLWLDGLNGVCDINGHTDILSALATHYLDGSECLVFQLNTPDDKSTMWVELNELPLDAREVAIEAICNAQ